MNTIVLMGRLARDPETKLATTQKGQTKVSRFPLVVKRNRTSKAFVVMITAYGNNAEFVEKYLEKGIKIALSGELQMSGADNAYIFELPFQHLYLHLKR